MCVRNDVNLIAIFASNMVEHLLKACSLMLLILVLDRRFLARFENSQISVMSEIAAEVADKPKNRTSISSKSESNVPVCRFGWIRGKVYFGVSWPSVHGLMSYKKRQTNIEPPPPPLSKAAHPLAARDHKSPSSSPLALRLNLRRPPLQEKPRRLLHLRAPLQQIFDSRR